jgi:Domain of unknown function (DUF4326)
MGVSIINMRGRRGVIPPNAVYVGRAVRTVGLSASKWANPFRIVVDGTRLEAIDKYRVWLLAHPDLMLALAELRGKDLACWCAPRLCHAEVLREFANQP